MIFSPRRGIVAVATALLVIAAAAGCSSSGGGRKAGTPAATGPTTAAAPSPSAQLSAADRTQIEQAYADFFAGGTSATVSQRYLQQGSAFAAVLAAQAKTSQAQALTAKVTSITARSAALAAVTFALSSHGSTLLPSASGYAVKEDGRWKVAASTFCQLLGLQGSKPTACSDASVTSLPSG